jgi:hypothetical protein
MSVELRGKVYSCGAGPADIVVLATGRMAQAVAVGSVLIVIGCDVDRWIYGGHALRGRALALNSQICFTPVDTAQRFSSPWDLNETGGT